MTPYPHPLALFPTRISLRVAPTIWTPGKGYSTYSSCVLNENFSFTGNINEKHVSPVWWQVEVFIFAAGRSFTHSPLLPYIYMGRGYTVEDKLWKYELEFKELKSTTRVRLPAIHVYATISIALKNSYQGNCYLPLKQWNQLWNVHCVKLVSG